jgi:hypothetical protein
LLRALLKTLPQQVFRSALNSFFSRETFSWKQFVITASTIYRINFRARLIEDRVIPLERHSTTRTVLNLEQYIILHSTGTEVG